MPAWQWHMGASQRSGPTCNKHHLQTSSISPCGLLLSAHLDARSRTAGGRSPLPDPPPLRHRPVLSQPAASTSTCPHCSSEHACLHGSSRQREAGLGLDADQRHIDCHVLPCHRPTSTLAPDPPPSSAQACQDSTQTSWQHVCRHPTATLDRSLQICGACDHTSETRSAHLTDQRCTALCTRTKSPLKRATFLVGTDNARRSCRPKITASGDHPRPQNYSRNHLTNNITKMTL